jgi:hypothetical protein
VVVLGLILLALSAAAGAAVAVSNPSAASVEALGYTLGGLTLGGVFLVGMGVGALGLLGLWLMARGAARKRAKKVALKREVEHVRSEQETLAEENARLQAQLEQEQPVYPAGGEARPKDAVRTSGSRGRHAR